jgi:hypothetical protein
VQRQFQRDRPGGGERQTRVSHQVVTVLGFDNRARIVAPQSVVRERKGFTAMVLFLKLFLPLARSENV